ncbi:hypothetical protein OG21DRAFT_1207030 [Imleria badia]|nr:hypothetical protein OG21DRAFT_1207030 [Imleria badia]
MFEISSTFLLYYESSSHALTHNSQYVRQPSNLCSKELFILSRTESRYSSHRLGLAEARVRTLLHHNACRSELNAKGLSVGFWPGLLQTLPTLRRRQRHSESISLMSARGGAWSREITLDRRVKHENIPLLRAARCYRNDYRHVSMTQVNQRCYDCSSVVQIFRSAQKQIRGLKVSPFPQRACPTVCKKFDAV